MPLYERLPGHDWKNPCCLPRSALPAREHAREVCAGRSLREAVAFHGATKLKAPQNRFISVAPSRPGAPSRPRAPSRPPVSGEGATDSEAFRVRYFDEGSGPVPVVLVHGIGMFCECWLPSFGAIAETTRTLAPDLPGHGLNQTPAEFSFLLADYVAFLDSFLRALNIGPVVLIGHSLGGAIAARFAMHFPARCAGLVLVAPAGFGKQVSPMFRLFAVPGVGEAVTRPTQAAISRLVSHLMYKPESATEEFREQLRTYALQPGHQSALLRTVRQNGTVFGPNRDFYLHSVDSFTVVQCGTLVIWGRNDRIVPSSDARRLSSLPRVRTMMLSKCGHFPMFEQTELVNRAILEFLAARIE